MPKPSRELTAKQAVRVWLAQNDMTQDGLANDLGFSQAYLSRVLCGYRPPSDELVSRMKRRTGIDLRDYEGVGAA